MAKSIIDVQVDSGSFDAFKAEFEKYKSALEEMPETWQEISGEIGEGAAAAEVYADRISKAQTHSKNLNALLDQTVDDWNKIHISVNAAYSDESTKRADKLKKSTFDARTWMKDAAEYSKSLGERVKDTTESLLKWSGIVGVFSGLAGAGGLFGINRMAANAGNLRYESMGLGVTGGQYQAAGINFNKAVDNPSALMGSIQNAQYDVSKRWAFNAMGVNPNNANLTQLTGEMLKAAKRTFASSGSTLQGAEAHGLTQFFSLNDLVRLKNMSDAEIDAMSKRAEADSKQLALSDRTLRSWQDFNQQMNRSGTQIENTFISGLLPLAKPLGNLSDAFSKAVGVFLKSPLIGEGLEKLAGGLDTFSKYLESPDFPKDVQSFMTTLKELVTGVGSIVKGIVRIGQWFSGKTEDIAPGAPDSVTIAGVNIPRPEMAKPEIDPATGKPKPFTFGVPDAQHGSSGLDKRSWFSGIADKAADDLKASKEWSDDPNNLYNKWFRKPIAERQHNPLNLRAAPGAPVVNGFAAFNSDDEGLRAAAWQLRRYGSGATTGKPLNTINDIVSTWAPKSDNNDTDAYIKSVVKSTNYKADQQLNMNDPAVLAQLIAAMSKVENSRSNFTPGGVQVTISNNTGGNANVSTMQLAH